MNQLLTFSRREGFIFFIAAVVSLFLSLWIACRDSVINPDAVCYLLSAEAVGSMGIRGAMNLCGQASWPFYSALIYAFTQISHLSYTASAYLLNGIFSCISVTAFILAVRELGASRRVLSLAALVILCAHEFISTREYIVRDHGFWAFYLVSLLLMLRYVQRPQWTTALAWSASLCAATLFRIEGAFFLLVLPVISAYISGRSLRQRLLNFFMLNLPLALIGAGIICWLLSHPAQSLDKLGRLSELSNQLHHGLVLMAERYQNMKAWLAQNLLTGDSARDAGIVLILMMLSWYAVSVIANLSWVYALLVVYAWRRPLASRLRGVIIAYVMVNVLVTFSFLTEHLFLSNRYLIALSLTLMLWVPFALDALLQKSASVRHRLILWLVALYMAGSAIAGVVDFGYSKAYIHQAGDWVAANTSANAAIYANDYTLMYYTRRFGFEIFTKARTYLNASAIAHGQWKQYDYLALRLNRKDAGATASLLQEINLTPIQVFSNKRGDRVAIYKVLRGDK